MERKFFPLDEICNDPEWGEFVNKPAFPFGILVADLKGVKGLNANIMGKLENETNVIIGGDTCSGKTTFLNSAIINLLKNTKADELKLILVDPKRVELTLYDGIPNLLFPVITKPEKAKEALQWCLAENKRRLELFKPYDVDAIGSYNKKSSEKIPMILVVIDEFSDLMVKDFNFFKEAVIAICGQRSKTGITIMISTSRPDPVNIYPQELVDAFRIRIIFSTSSEANSKTVIGEAGGEELLGKGDAIMKIIQKIYLDDDDRKEVTHILKPFYHFQGFYVSEEEIVKTVNSLKI